MAAPTRRAMRLLSPRLRLTTHQPSPCIRQLRYASSRYSSPGSRTATENGPVEASSFIGSSGAATLQPSMAQAAQGINPLDARASQLAAFEKRQFHMRRMRFAGMGLLLSILGLAMVIYNLDIDSIEQAEKKRRGHQLDASDEANAVFQGREVHIIGAGEGKRIVASDASGEVELVETGTSSVPHFPRTIHLPTASDDLTPRVAGAAVGDEEYTLVGLGIRTVLWIQVYVVGMYVRTKDISGLQEKLIHGVNPVATTLVPAEKEALKKKLLDPEHSREIWSELLEVPGMKTAFRIAPTRNTDFGHLRDGFVNGINARVQETKQKSKPEVAAQFDEEDFGQAIQTLRGIFTGGKAPKGSTLILSREKNGALDVWYQGKQADENSKPPPMERLGAVADERIARLIWMGYLAGDKVSSKGAREGVVEGCVSFASRPVGSVETMVV